MSGWLPLAPLATLLLAIALGPLVAPDRWERLRCKAYVSGAVGGPVLLWAMVARPQQAWHSLQDYLSFVVLLACLTVGAGAICLGGARRASLASNTLLLAQGGFMASWVGTTGAALVTLPALVRGNLGRRRTAHLGVFFIVIVANFGGLLTPLGDPPLFLGYLKGVPFWWTLRLWPAWAAGLAYLLATFVAVEAWRLRQDPPPPQPTDPAPLPAGWRGNLLPVLALAAQMGWLMLAGSQGWRWGIGELGQLGLAAMVYRRCGPRRRRQLSFSWAPWQEVAVLFAGLFAAMIPALAWVQAHAGGLSQLPPAALFWATGLISSCLDNAPTYLTMAGGVATGLGLAPDQLGAVADSAAGGSRLAAIALGSVVMGGLTYLGNGPNLLVRAIAQERGLRMPGFVAYSAGAAVLMAPLLLAIGALL